MNTLTDEAIDYLYGEPSKVHTLKEDKEWRKHVINELMEKVRVDERAKAQVEIDILMKKGEGSVFVDYVRRMHMAEASAAKAQPLVEALEEWINRKDSGYGGADIADRDRKRDVLMEALAAYRDSDKTLPKSFEKVEP